MKLIYLINYQVGTYKGNREVLAEDGDEAIEIVKSQIRKEMSLPMFYEKYEIADSKHEYAEDYD